VSHIRAWPVKPAGSMRLTCPRISAPGGSTLPLGVWSGSSVYALNFLFSLLFLVLSSSFRRTRKRGPLGTVEATELDGGGEPSWVGLGDGKAVPASSKAKARATNSAADFPVLRGARTAVVRRVKDSIGLLRSRWRPCIAPSSRGSGASN